MQSTTGLRQFNPSPDHQPGLDMVPVITFLIQFRGSGDQ